MERDDDEPFVIGVWGVDEGAEIGVAGVEVCKDGREDELPPTSLIELAGWMGVEAGLGGSAVVVEVGARL